MASKIEVDEIFNAGGDNDTGIDLATNDQILLKVANATRLTMNSTGQTTIVGEGGSTTTSVQQGLCKSWCHFTGSGTIAIDDSFNSASLTDAGTGDYEVLFTNAMNNANYSAQGATSGDSIRMFDHATTKIDRILCIGHAGSSEDVASVATSVDGDLA